MKYIVTLGGETLELEVERRADGSYGVRDAAGAELAVRSVSAAATPGLVSLLVEGHHVVVQLTDGEVRFRQQRYGVRAESLRDRAATLAALAGDAGQARKIFASMPGRIVRVMCAPGEAVKEGSPLVVIEAMKMQNELCAKADAVVRVVHVGPGQNVERGALLVELE